LVGLLILGATAAGAVAMYRHYQVEQFATNRAAGIGAALMAADRYARKYETQLLKGEAIVGFANPNSPSIQELITAGLMTPGFNQDGANGGPLKVAVRTEPTGCVGAKCQLAVSAYPTGSILDKAGQPDRFLASKIAHAVPGGSGWTNLPGDDAKLSKNAFWMPNPLGSTPAVVVAQEWIGSNKPSSVVPPVSYETKDSNNCAYGGTTTYQRSVTTDKWGVVTYGSWTYLTDDCAPPPPPPPPPPIPPTQPPVTGPSSPALPTTCVNGASDYPTCTAGPGSGSCSNGATDYPACTVSTPPPTCPNGASNYPTCTPPTCGNGATNYPTCSLPIPVTCSEVREYYDNGIGSTCGFRAYDQCSDGTSTFSFEVTGTHFFANGTCVYD
jgi:hypothetical protein